MSTNRNISWVQHVSGRNKWIFLSSSVCQNSWFSKRLCGIYIVIAKIFDRNDDDDDELDWFRSSNKSKAKVVAVIYSHFFIKVFILKKEHILSAERRLPRLCLSMCVEGVVELM